MKKTVWIVLLGVMCVSSLTAKAYRIRGSEQHKTQEVYSVAPFTALSVSGQIEVEFVQGPEGTYTAQFTGPYNLAELVNIKSAEDVLSISYTKPLVVLGDEHVRVKIAAPNLKRIEVKQSGEVHSHNTLVAEELVLRTDGKGEIELDEVSARAVSAELQGDSEIEILFLTCDILQVNAQDTASVDVQNTRCARVISRAHNRAQVEITGLNSKQVIAETFQSSETEIKGQTDLASLTARDRSEIDAEGLQAADADVMAERAAHVGVRVTGTLNAQTQGRGVVEYKGWPQEINRTGKGTLKQDK